MPSFQIVERPSLSPSVCGTCGGIQGPFVDTLTTRQPHGRLYICVPFCVAQIARLCGLFTRETSEEAAALVERLRDELAEARGQQVVPLSEVLVFLETRVAGRGELVH